ncbi:ABC transporter substrate-binding protein [Paenibacillus mucilaginosus K02]|uniref:ABC transporter substrate-binding protein n=1 Tax=Paenibacillus mucilaginosus K02 TaxID=997761 RepID=I0BKZ5_9BACL|nr:ABC transporter substrate-binding protein [Paenibacillus mucilaginosus K02]
MIPSLIRRSAVLLSVLALPLSGCAGSADREAEQAQPQAKAEAAPVELTFYTYGNTLTNTEFEQFFAAPVRQAHPHITLKRITPPPETTPEELLSSGTLPDLIYTSDGSYTRFTTLGAVEDLYGLVQKHGFDLSRLKPVLTESIRSYSGKGELVALPFSHNLSILYYNKDIFDKFGVPYPPAEGLTWDQALELGKQLTRSEDGIRYIGIDPGGPAQVARSLSLPLIDPQSGRVALQSAGWSKVFSTLKQAYEIPGFVGPEGKFSYDKDTFMKDQTLAMRVSYLANMIGPLEELRKEGRELNWDLAPPPYYEEPKVSGSIHSLLISKHSRHKDEAFAVIATALGDEVQRKAARNGRVPSIHKPELQQEYGADIEVLQGKNLGSVFKVEPRQVTSPSEYDAEAGKWLTKAAEDLALNGTDVNTVLRKAQEGAGKEIEALRRNK